MLITIPGHNSIRQLLFAFEIINLLKNDGTQDIKIQSFLANYRKLCADYNQTILAKDIKDIGDITNADNLKENLSDKDISKNIKKTVFY